MSARICTTIILDCIYYAQNYGHAYVFLSLSHTHTHTHTHTHVHAGGVVSAVIDRDALTDASETNPDIQTTDKFTLELLEAGVFQGLEDKCIVEVSLTDREDLQLTLTSTNDMYSEYCNSKSEVCEECV